MAVQVRTRQTYYRVSAGCFPSFESWRILSPVAKLFDEFTKKQKTGIRRTLKAVHLKVDTERHWQKRILPDITTVLMDLSEGNAHPDSLMYPGEVKKRFVALTKAYDQLGERLQWTLDDRLGCRLPEVLESLVADPGGKPTDEQGLKEWAALVEKETAQHIVLPAGRRAAEPPNPHVHIQTKGRPKDHVIRLMVRALLEIFERETGIPPTVYPYPLLKRATKTPKSGVEYRGTFYPFALACLAPVFPAQELSSAILTAYNEVKRIEENNRHPASKRAKRIK